jgi:alpha-glucosidase
VLSLYRRLIRLRNGNAALNSGGVEGVSSKGNVLGYERVDGEQRFSVLLNFNDRREEAPIGGGRIVASTHMDRSGEVVEGNVSLRAFEGVVVKVSFR